MEEFLRIKLKPGDLTGYIADWGEYPTILRIGPDRRHTYINPVVRRLIGSSPTRTIAALINDTLQDNEDNPANRLKFAIRVNEDVFNDPHGNITIAGLTDGLYTYIRQTDFNSANGEYMYTKIATYDFYFVPIVSGCDVILLESSDGCPLFRGIVLVDEFMADSLSYVNSMLSNVGPYDFPWDNIEHVWWCSRNMTLYNERALSSMDSKILAYMAGFNIN